MASRDKTITVLGKRFATRMQQRMIDRFSDHRRIEKGRHIPGFRCEFQKKFNNQPPSQINVRI